MAGKQPAAAGTLSLSDVERILASSGVTKAIKTKLMAEATKMAKASEPQADPLKAEKEAALALAASFAQLALNRALALEPCSLEPARTWALSDALTTVLKDVVAVCPDEAASLRVVNDGVKGFYGGASASAMKTYEALVNSTHNLKPGLLSAMPPEVLERIMMHVPQKLVVGRTSVSSLSSAMACKALAQACTANTATIELSWTIDNFLTLGHGRIYGPGNGLEILSRRWQIMVNPKGEGQSKDTHVSVFLYGTRSASASGKESYRTSVKIEVPLSVPAVCLDFTREADFYNDSSWGFPSFIPLADLSSPAKTILHNGSLTIKIAGRIWRVVESPLKAA